MKTQFQYITVYKDSAKAPVHCFGPFVSESLALTFMEDLPEPLPGGTKSVKLLSLFAGHEVVEAGEQIIRERNPRHPITQALFIPYDVSTPETRARDGY